MNTEDAVKLYVALQKVSNARAPSTPYPTKYVYAVEYNLRKLEPVFKSYQTAANPMDVPEIKDYEEDRIKSLTAVAVKNEDGSPKVSPQNEFIFDNDAIRDKAIAEVLERHPDYMTAIKNHENRLA